MSGFAPSRYPGWPQLRRSFTAAVHPELFQDAVDVILDRGQLDGQPGSDCLVGQSVGYQFGDLRFALG